VRVGGSVGGRYAHVRCVVQIEREVQEELVEFQKSGLKLTRKHPIFVNGQWHVPSSLVNLESFSAKYCRPTSKYVYNFLLDKNHVILVNGIECVTFGHGIQDPVAWHPFYASNGVTDLLTSLPGFADGIVRTYGSLRTLHKDVEMSQ